MGACSLCDRRITRNGCGTTSSDSGCTVSSATTRWWRLTRPGSGRGNLPAGVPGEGAHGEGLAITLHMVKSHAVADSANIEWIRRSFQSYPNMNLILAYSARGFQPAHNLEGDHTPSGTGEPLF